jgi:catechol 2,3-dioxygenase-like lactoylglutathione lyase family enzyme
MTYRVLHMSRIFSVHVQVRELDRSLSFYRNALGLQADRNDGTLAMLRGRGDSRHTLVSRRIGDHAAWHSLGEVGVSRLAVRMTGSADLDRAEELLTRHQVPYRRHHVVNAGHRYPVIMSHGPYAKGLAFADGFPARGRSWPPSTQRSWPDHLASTRTGRPPTRRNGCRTATCASAWTAAVPAAHPATEGYARVSSDRKWLEAHGLEHFATLLACSG